MDNIGLAKVDVNIVVQDGTSIENGKAVEIGTGSGKWTYTVTKDIALDTDVFIQIKGVDHAGNEAQITETPRLGKTNNIALIEPEG